MPGLQFLNLAAHYELTRSEVAACALLGLILAGILAAMTGAITALAGGYLLFSMLLVMLIDYRHLIIPNVLSLPAIPLGLAAALFTFPIPWADIISDHLLAAAVAGGVSFAVRHIYRRLRGVEGLGMGDVKLAAAAGAWGRTRFFGNDLPFCNTRRSFRSADAKTGVGDWQYELDDSHSIWEFHRSGDCNHVAFQGFHNLSAVWVLRGWKFFAQRGNFGTAAAT